MAFKQGVMKGYNGRELVVYENEITGAKNVLVLIHGMQEHARRYEWFSEMLSAKGIAFFAADLRGHGKNITSKPGLDDGNIYKNIVEDYKIFITNIKNKYPAAKVVLMGHSYGSFLTQRFVRDYLNMVDKVILCGSSYMNTILIKAAKLLSFLNKCFKGREAEAYFIEN